MPRISAVSNAAQRENTRRAILDSFGQLLYEHGLTGLTMTHVARNAEVGRTAVYNYFADMGQLLVAYALDETQRFLDYLETRLAGVENPVEKLEVYIRTEIEDLSRRHLPPGPVMRSVLSPEDYRDLGRHVSGLQRVLVDILQEAIDQGWLPADDIRQLATLVHSSLSSAASREEHSEEDREGREQHIRATIRFIQRGLGAQFDAEGRPVPLPPAPAALEQVS